MLRDILYKGKELAEKVTNIMMNYTEVEMKVREATNDEICCPHGRLLQKLADYTYNHETYLEVMSTLWKRMHSDGECSWRRVYKSLIVLAFLLKNGSDYVAQGARDHIYDIRTLESFRYFDEHGRDQGVNVRIKVQEVIDLLQDPEKLQQERQKAKASRHLYTGYGNTSESDWGYASHGGGDYYRRSDPLDAYDKEVYTSKNFTFQSRTASKTVISQMESDLPPPKLGSFDDWHVGKERGVVDDVLEQFKEAWDLAKESTKDLIFTKKSPDLRTNESNPRMVSEEVYEFPPDACESSGTYELRTRSSLHSDYPSTQNKFSSINSLKSTNISHRNINVNSNAHATSQSSDKSMDNAKQIVTQPKHEGSGKNDSKPRPPSCDLIDSFDTSTTKADQVIDLFDTFNTMHITNTSLLPQKQQPHQVRNNFDANWSNSLFPIAVSSGNNLIQNNTTVSRQNHDNLLDNEFGEFTSASVQSPTFVTPTVAGNSSLSSFDSFGFDSSNTDFYLNMPTETIKPQQQLSSSSSSQQHQQTVQSNPTSPSKSKSLNIGSTWKDLESLSIDLDALVKPEKYGTRTQAPSLYQLKQNQPRVQS